VKKQLDLLKVVPVIFSDFNYGLLRSGKKLDDYEQFLSIQENKQ